MSYRAPSSSEKSATPVRCIFGLFYGTISAGRRSVTAPSVCRLMLKRVIAQCLGYTIRIVRFSRSPAVKRIGGSRPSGHGRFLTASGAINKSGCDDPASAFCGLAASRNGAIGYVAAATRIIAADSRPAEDRDGRRRQDRARERVELRRPIADRA